MSIARTAVPANQVTREPVYVLLTLWVTTAKLVSIRIHSHSLLNQEGRGEGQRWEGLNFRASIASLSFELANYRFSQNKSSAKTVLQNSNNVHLKKSTSNVAVLYSQQMGHFLNSKGQFLITKQIWKRRSFANGHFLFMKTGT